MPHDAEKPPCPSAGLDRHRFASPLRHCRPFPRGMRSALQRSPGSPGPESARRAVRGSRTQEREPNAPCRIMRTSSSKTRRPETRPARVVSNCDTDYHPVLDPAPLCDRVLHGPYVPAPPPIPPCVVRAGAPPPVPVVGQLIMHARSGCRRHRVDVVAQTNYPAGLNNAGSAPLQLLLR